MGVNLYCASFRRLVSISMPVITGMLMSLNTMSKGSKAAFRNPAAPSSASTTSKPARARVILTS